MRKCEQENQRKRENLCVECCALMRTSLDSCIYIVVVVKQREPADDLFYSLRIENLSTSDLVKCYEDYKS